MNFSTKLNIYSIKSTKSFQRTSINSFRKNPVGSNGHITNGSNIHFALSSFNITVC
jgi:hypothetical protein